MKKLKTGLILTLAVLCCFGAALAAGTFAIGTETETLGGVVPNASSITRVTWVVPPLQVTAISVDDRVSLSWDTVTDATQYGVYEKINGSWVMINTATTVSIGFSAEDGEHTYGISAIRYDKVTGIYYESKQVRKVTLEVLNGSDQPAASADVLDVTISGTGTREQQLMVYDNTYLHIRADSLTWLVTDNGTLVQPDLVPSAMLYTSLGNDFYLKGTRHLKNGTGELVINTYAYTTETYNGVRYYRRGAQRAALTLKLTYVSGDAPTHPAGGKVAINGYQYKISGSEAACLGFEGSGFSTVRIPNSISVGGQIYPVTSIGTGAFQGETKVKKLVLESNLKIIGKKAFSGCVNLKTISNANSAANSLDILRDYAFDGCVRLANLPAFEHLQTVGAYAFRNCSAMKAVTLGAGVKSIGKRAFYGCGKLKTITLRTLLLTSGNVGSNAFKGINSRAVFQCPYGKAVEYQILLRAKGAGKYTVFIQ